MAAAGLVLDVAAREVGQREVGGNNRGPAVARYMAAVGLGEGGAWCAAFVAWCFQRADVRGWPATADTWAIRDWARQHGVVRTAPVAGDVFLLYGPDSNPMHTGFVERVRGGIVDTIEGNTGGPSDTDGDGVYRKSRPVDLCKFVHWQELLAPESAPERVKVFWHGGRGSIVIDGQTRPIRGVKVNGQPWAGGEIIVGL